MAQKKTKLRGKNNTQYKPISVIKKKRKTNTVRK